MGHFLESGLEFGPFLGVGGPGFGPLMSYFGVFWAISGGSGLSLAHFWESGAWIWPINELFWGFLGHFWGVGLEFGPFLGVWGLDSALLRGVSAWIDPLLNYFGWFRPLN